jgi:carboxyl-terminal processing protease
MNKINCIFAFLLILLPSVSAQKENVWVVTADVQNMGKISFYMLENQSEKMLVTPEGRDKKLLGGFKATMLRAISKRKHDNSLVTIELKESGAINLLLLKMQLVDFKANTDSISGKIFSPDGKNEIGNLYAVKTDFSAENLQQMLDYYSIVNQINNTTVQNIYNPALVQSKKWHNFIANFKEKASIAKDDLEFVLLFYINAGKAGFSHFSLIKDEIDLERTLPEPQIEANALNDSVAYIKVKTLAGKISEIDSIFSIYQRNRIKIIDLRDMPGGVLKNTYQLASQLIADTIDGGYFVTRQCFENENCKQSPAKSDFPVLQNTDFESFTNILKNKEGVKIKLFPNKNALIPDNQQLYILINSNTASAGEPLVYGLKNSKNVIVVGEKTAGQMLSPEVFDVGNGFFLSVPIADYFTNDGKSIEGKGVTPTIKIKSEKALEWVLRKLGTK